jgi:hypothetical protein
MIEILIESLKLEDVGKRVSGAVKNPGEGISAAITICCSEEVSFCDIICPHCRRVLIDPLYMPSLQMWTSMTEKERIETLQKGFILWKQEVIEKGRDWRQMPLPTEEFPLGAPIIEMEKMEIK